MKRCYRVENLFDFGSKIKCFSLVTTYVRVMLELIAETFRYFKDFDSRNNFSKKNGISYYIS